MKIAVLKELAPGERRVSATPDTIKKLTGLGASLSVESGAGDAAKISDASYAEAGAAIVARAEAASGADLILCVQGPEPDTLQGIRPGTVLLGNLNPYGERARIDAYAALGIDALAMEFLPRTTRAQAMDTLSSQSNLAGYRAVLDATHEFGRALPMMTTAAGTIAAARVFVMGVGVAGLQAIATARRLGAQVSATDVRSATREQIESLGAKAIFVDKAPGIEGEGTGGYAAEMSEEYRKAQAELVSAHIAKQDIVITTALIPGKPAPRLIADAQIATMKPGSVILDLAIEQGGNVEGAVADQIVTRHGVTIVAHRNMPSRLASDASALFARNLFNFVAAYWDKEAGRPAFPEGDELVSAVRLTGNGRVTNARLLPPSNDASGQ